VARPLVQQAATDMRTERLNAAQGSLAAGHRVTREAAVEARLSRHLRVNLGTRELEQTASAITCAAEVVVRD
jgi:hypothetical protein